MSDFENISNRVLAATVYDIVSNQFNNLADLKHKSITVEQLRSAEILEFIKIWKAQSASDGFSDTTVLITSDPDNIFDREFVAPKDIPITKYRNNNEGGLVYFETEQTSDSQSLKHGFKLSDTDILNDERNGLGSSSIFWLLDKAFKLSTGRENPASQRVRQQVDSVVRKLRNKENPPSLRPFIKFCVRISHDIQREERALNLAEINQIIGRAFSELELFSDEYWAESNDDNKIQRRLQLNSEFSQFHLVSGQEIPADEVINRLEETLFKNSEGEPFPETEQVKIRENCKNFCRSPFKPQRDKIPLFIFEQLFRKDTQGLKLGEKVRAEIEERAPLRLSEFDDLEVERGLNESQQEEAQRFLEHESNEDADLLKDLILTGTRRRIEKLATPSATSIENPFSAIASVCDQFNDALQRTNEERPLLIKLSTIADQQNENTTLNLFRFLYANLLNELCDQKENSLVGFNFEVSDELKSYSCKLPKDFNDQDEEDNDEDGLDEFEWGPVPLNFELYAINNGQENELLSSYKKLQWYPADIEGLAVFWLICIYHQGEILESVFSLPDGMSFSKYQDFVFRGILSPKALEKKELNSQFVSTNAIELSDLKQLIVETSEEGIKLSLLNDFTDKWISFAEVLRQNINGKDDQKSVLNDFLALLTIYGKNGSNAVILPSHPLKQRWLASYLKNSLNFGLQSLNRELLLNEQNTDYFINWNLNSTSHVQPPMICGQNGNYLFSDKEYGWFEYFSDSNSGVLGNLEIDDSIVNVIVPKIQEYLLAYPHKVDGLQLLIAISGSPSFPTQLIKELKKGEWVDLRVDVHVLCPNSIREKVIYEFETFSLTNRLSSGGLLHPEIHLHLHDLEDETLYNNEGINLDFDIGIRPQFFREDQKIEVETKKPSETASISFDPLLDNPTSIEISEQGEKVTVVQLPNQNDNFFETWSTLSVRHIRGRPVAPDNSENTDFLKLTSNFKKETRLFNFLHDRCHWVITVEKNISRQYIESLDNQPAILAVKEKVGNSNLYTMIISSNSGADYTVERIARKIRNILNCDLNVAQQIGRKVFSDAKDLAPSLALQAMGISRITEEILGLIIAKNIANASISSNLENGISGWISLDMYTNWFGGMGETRADMCRLEINLNEQNELEVDVLILEAKFRRSETIYGRSQIEKTIKLFSEFIDPDSRNLDSELWRNSLLDALDNASAKAKQAFGSIQEEIKANNGRITAWVREKFRKGEYKLKGLKGFYCQSIYGQSGNYSSQQIAIEDYHYEEIKTYSNHVEALALGKMAHLDETPAVNRDETTPERIEIDIRPVEEPDTNQPETSNNDAENNRTDNPNQAQTAESDRPSREEEFVLSENKVALSELTRRYQTIIDTLAEFSIETLPVPQEKEPHLEGPATIVYRIKLGVGVDPNKVMSRSDVLKLTLELKEEQELRITIDSGNLLIEVPKAPEERYFVTAESLWNKWARPESGLCCPLGIDQRGNVIALNFSSSNSPHLLIGGTTGSGKSEALNTILYGLKEHYSPQELKLSLVDPKTTELIDFEGDPHVDGQILAFDDETIEMLSEAVEEMEHRYRLMRDQRVRDITLYNQKVPEDKKLPWRVIVLDEYGDLTSDPDSKRDIEASAKRLAQKARAAGIHLIIATQKPSAEVISTNLRSNLPAQLALRVKSHNESRVIMDGQGAETLNGKGDAFLKAEGKLIRIQCGYVPS